MRPWTRGFAVASAALACAACGARTVNLGVDVGDGGSGSTDATSDSRPVGDATSNTGSPMDARSADSMPDTGMSFMRHDAAVTCVTCAATMGTCGGPGDCCENERCFDGYCLPPPQVCLAEGSPCQPPVTCCSGRCEPTGPGGTAACAPYCMPDNSPCEAARECCSLACNGGVCGGAICSTLGSSCQVDSDCCADACVSGHCGLPPSASCLPSGDSCGDGGIGCCSGFCNSETQRCGVLGAVGEYGTVLAPGAPCSHNGFSSCSQNETCTFSASAHVLTCQSEGPQGPCTPDGQRCGEPGDCCSKACTFGVCGTSCVPF
jgi:hypothetical protein